MQQARGWVNGCLLGRYSQFATTSLEPCRTSLNCDGEEMLTVFDMLGPSVWEDNTGLAQKKLSKLSPRESSRNKGRQFACLGGKNSRAGHYS